MGKGMAGLSGNSSPIAKVSSEQLGISSSWKLHQLSAAGFPLSSNAKDHDLERDA